MPEIAWTWDDVSPELWPEHVRKDREDKRQIDRASATVRANVAAWRARRSATSVAKVARPEARDPLMAILADSIGRHEEAHLLANGVVCQSTINNWRRGYVAHPRIDTLRRVALALGRDIQIVDAPKWLRLVGNSKS